MAEPAEPVVMCPPISGALGLAGKAVTAAPAGYSTVTAGPAETAVPPGRPGLLRPSEGMAVAAAAVETAAMPSSATRGPVGAPGPAGTERAPALLAGPAVTAGKAGTAAASD
ncbi:Uncharacterised protein [Mycobacterium tuberculosis]|uniref:Uncharacterized protein n=1 Tax=Mycobacterium tuberculosis TaxID=1773 RepID=A0A655JTU3_MYCTX|nr:Uncharacterised protein [Mycobacterium tuberculosis]CFC67372.1 Uncharacterised protein [Mycobacterium tuberculosis]CFR52496.1 Uncharacterised protein [Mycobacterium tuberculosis]CFS42018.1 Uncharacterised protein [Mycobacterium tuberculosis]CKR07388.1 Uncharacterised protein [Mycobacterium tuberculosis]